MATKTPRAPRAPCAPRARGGGVGHCGAAATRAGGAAELRALDAGAARVDSALNPSAFILWVDEIHFAPLGNHEKPLFGGIYRGIIMPGFL